MGYDRGENVTKHDKIRKQRQTDRHTKQTEQHRKQTKHIASMQNSNQQHKATG